MVSLEKKENRELTVKLENRVYKALKDQLERKENKVLKVRLV